MVDILDEVRALSEIGETIESEWGDLASLPEGSAFYTINDYGTGLLYVAFCKELRNSFTHKKSGLFGHSYYESMNEQRKPTPFGGTNAFASETFITYALVFNIKPTPLAARKHARFLTKLERALVRKHTPIGNFRSNPFAIKEFHSLLNPLLELEQDSLWDETIYQPLLSLYSQECARLQSEPLEKYLDDNYRYNYAPFVALVKELQANYQPSGNSTLSATSP